MSIKKVNILENIEYGDDKPLIGVLLNTNSVKEVRIVFKKGQQMKEHQAPGPIAVEVVEGIIDFGVAGQRHNLDKGSLIALEAAVPHDLIALQDSIVRLSIHKTGDAATVHSL